MRFPPRFNRATTILPSGIRSRLFLLIALVLVPSLLLLALVYHQRYEFRRHQELQNELELAHGIATAFSAYLEGVKHSTYSLGHAILTTSQDNPTQITYLLDTAAAQTPAVRNLSWVSPQGRILASSQPNLVGRDLSVRPYFQKIVEGRSFALGKLRAQGRVTDAPTFATAVAILEDERLQGSVVAGIEPTRLGEITLTFHRQPGGSYILFDQEGTVVFNSPSGPLPWEDRTRWAESDPVLRGALESGEDQVGIAHLQVPGGEWVLARVPVGEFGWIVGAGRPVELALAPIQKRILEDVLAALLITSLAFLLAYFLSRSIAGPLRRLEQDARGMGEGRIVEEEDLLAPTEVRRLRQTVTTLARDLLAQAEAFREKEEQFRTLADNISQLAWMADENGHLFWVNQRWMEYTGQASTSGGWEQIVHPDHAQSVEKNFRNSIRRGEVWEDTFPLRGRDGAYRWFLSRAIPIRGDSGRVQRWFGTNTDITELKNAEEERARVQASLEDSHRRLFSILQRMTDGFLTVDRSWRLTHFNARAEELTGRRAEEVLGGNFWEIWPESIGSPFEPVLRQAAESGEPIHLEGYYPPFARWLEVHAYPDQGVAIFFRDITERKAQEENLLQSRNRLELALEAVKAGVSFWEPNTGHIEWNARHYELLGYEPGSFQPDQHKWLERLHPEDQKRVPARIREAIAHREKDHTDEYRILLPNNQIRWIRSARRFTYSPQGEILYSIGIIFEITAEKQYEETLRESEAQLRQLAETLPHIVWITRADGYHEYFNSRWYEFTGMSFEDSRGDLWSSVLHPDDYERTFALWRHCLETGEPYEVEYRFRRGQDGEYCWFLSRAIPVRNEQGQIQRWFGTCTDIQELKNLEESLKVAKESAEEANRAKSEFLANTSHELRTPLTVIMTSLELLALSTSSPEQSELMEMAENSAHRLLGVIDDLLDLTRIEARKLKIEPRTFDLRECVQKSVRIFEESARVEGLELHWEVAPEVPDMVYGDPDRIGQILVNLVGNAVKFTEEGRVTVTVALADGDLRFSVQDTGIGIPAGKIDSLFTPFTQVDSSLTRRFGGTGLGLAICRELVHLMGGTIRVESQEGQGSTFTFSLPLLTTGGDLIAPQEQGPSSLRRMKILLAEDDQGVRDLIEMALQRRGAEVRSAQNGREALELWEEGGFDLVLMDLQMPEMDGLEATARIRAQEAGKRRRTPIVALTAHARPENREQCLEAEMDDFLTKPIRIDELNAFLKRYAPVPESERERI